MEHVLALQELLEGDIDGILGKGFCMVPKSIQNIRLTGGVGIDKIGSFWNSSYLKSYEKDTGKSFKDKQTPTMESFFSKPSLICKKCEQFHECKLKAEKLPHQACAFCKACTNNKICFSYTAPSHVPYMCKFWENALATMDKLPQFYLDFLRPISDFYTEQDGCKIESDTGKLVCRLVDFFKLSVGEKPDISYWKLILEYIPFLYEYDEIFSLLSKLPVLNEFAVKELNEKVSSMIPQKTICDIEQAQTDMIYLLEFKKKLSSCYRSKAKNLWEQKAFTGLSILYLLNITGNWLPVLLSWFKLRPADLNLIYNIEVFLLSQQKTEIINDIDDRLQKHDQRRLPEPVDSKNTRVMQYQL